MKRLLLVMILVLTAAALRGDPGADLLVIPPASARWTRTDTGGPYTRATFAEGRPCPPAAALRFAEPLDLRPGLVLADVGGGNGWLLEALLPFVQPGGGGVVQDINPLAVEAARARGLAVVHGDPWHVRLEPGTVDRAVLHQTHFFVNSPREPWTLSCLRSLFLALRPGGLVLAVDHAAWGRQSARVTAKPFLRVGFDLVRLEEEWPDPMGGPKRSHLMVFRRR